MNGIDLLLGFKGKIGGGKWLKMEEVNEID